MKPSPPLVVIDECERSVLSAALLNYRQALAAKPPDGLPTALLARELRVAWNLLERNEALSPPIVYDVGPTTLEHWRGAAQAALAHALDVAAPLPLDTNEGLLRSNVELLARQVERLIGELYRERERERRL